MADVIVKVSVKLSDGKVFTGKKKVSMSDLHVPTFVGLLADFIKEFLAKRYGGMVIWYPFNGYRRLAQWRP